VTQVRAEKRFAKEIDELVTGRMTAEELAPLMPRAVKRAVALFNVVDQGAKERRAKLGFILQRCRFQLASIEIVAGVRTLKNAMNTPQVLCRDNFFFMCGNKNRNIESGCFNFVYRTMGNIADRQHYGGNINIICCAEIHHFTMRGKAIRAGATGGNL